MKIEETVRENVADLEESLEESLGELAWNYNWRNGMQMEWKNGWRDCEKERNCGASLRGFVCRMHSYFLIYNFFSFFLYLNFFFGCVSSRLLLTVRAPERPKVKRENKNQRNCDPKINKIEIQLSRNKSSKTSPHVWRLSPNYYNQCFVNQ